MTDCKVRIKSEGNKAHYPSHRNVIDRYSILSNLALAIPTPVYLRTWSG